MSLNQLFEQFVNERRFLKNSSELTIKYYYRCWIRFQRAIPDLDHLDKPILNQFVVRLRESGISTVTCNMTIRGINSFMSWLHENGYVSEHLKIKQLKVEKKVLKTFSDSHLKAILSCKPKGFYQWRLYALLCLLIDTGIRIEEALTIQTSKVDYENMLITVRGKGNKQRIVPMSLELRKVLYKYQRQHDHCLLFPTKDGNRLSYYNIIREFKNLCKSLGIEGVRVSFHTLRHGFLLIIFAKVVLHFTLRKQWDIAT